VSGLITESGVLEANRQALAAAFPERSRVMPAAPTISRVSLQT